MSTKKEIEQYNTRFGFVFGAATVERICRDEKTGSVVIGLRTPKQKKNGWIEIYVTRTGKVRITDELGEWTRVDENN